MHIVAYFADLTLLGHIRKDMALAALETSGRIRLSTPPKMGDVAESFFGARGTCCPGWL
jgi:hypothetical protein